MLKKEQGINWIYLELQIVIPFCATSKKYNQKWNWFTIIIINMNAYNSLFWQVCITLLPYIGIKSNEPELRGREYYSTVYSQRFGSWNILEIQKMKNCSKVHFLTGKSSKYWCCVREHNLVNKFFLVRFITFYLLLMCIYIHCNNGGI